MRPKDTEGTAERRRIWASFESVKELKRLMAERRLEEMNEQEEQEDSQN